jgi:hypothetical protein
MAIGGDGVVHLVWPTVIDGETPQGALFYASTRDGQTFTPRQRIATSGGPKPSHPQIVVGAHGRVIVAWDEVVDGVRRAAARSLRVTQDGQMTAGAVVSIGGTAAGAYPVMAMTDHGVVSAWTHGTGATAVVHVARLAVP